MLAGVVHRAKDTATQTARTAAFGLGGTLCLIVGLGFLTGAAWLFLITVTTPLNTALILGSVYAGIGFILFAIAAQKTAPQESVEAPKASASDSDEIVPQMIAAFMTGVQAGQKARS